MISRGERGWLAGGPAPGSGARRCGGPVIIRGRPQIPSPGRRLTRRRHARPSAGHRRRSPAERAGLASGGRSLLLLPLPPWPVLSCPLSAVRRPVSLQRQGHRARPAGPVLRARTAVLTRRMARRGGAGRAPPTRSELVSAVLSAHWHVCECGSERRPGVGALYVPHACKAAGGAAGCRSLPHAPDVRRAGPGPSGRRYGGEWAESTPLCHGMTSAGRVKCPTARRPSLTSRPDTVTGHLDTGRPLVTGQLDTGRPLSCPASILRPSTRHDGMFDTPFVGKSAVSRVWVQ